MIFDTHAHYDDRQFEEDREELLGSMRENGVELIVDAASDIARQLDLPVIIHSREAAADTMEIMKQYAGELSGVIHCFSYSPEQAKEYVKMGFYLGIGGVVTFKNAKKLKEVVQEIPLESLVLETDSPYLAPVPNRGKRNSSLNLVYVAEEIAGLKGISYEEVVRQTTENAKKLYRFKK